MLHVMDVSNFRRFTHVADGVDSAKILDVNTVPALVGDPRLTPLPGHGRLVRLHRSPTTSSMIAPRLTPHRATGRQPLIYADTAVMLCTG